MSKTQEPREVVALRRYGEWADSEHGKAMLAKPLSHLEAFAAGMAAVTSDTLDATLANACEWFDKTIPHTADDDVTKFREESKEFLENPSVEEASDAMLCLWHWAHLRGLDLHAAIQAKMAKNASRKWEKQSDGTWHHVKPEDRHSHRCLNCGRTWACPGDCQTADGRCLACGSLIADWERQGESIDFRHQATEKGEPYLESHNPNEMYP